MIRLRCAVLTAPAAAILFYDNVGIKIGSKEEKKCSVS